MRVLVGGVSSERQLVKSLISFYAMKVRDDDLRVAEFGKPGVHARKYLGNFFESKTEYDALLMLDMDMLYPEDMLEKFRAHDKDIVTAHYFRRRTDPMLSVIQTGEKWPYIPLVDVPSDGLHEVATSGFGAVLITREVYMAVKNYLPDKGHPFDLGPLPWLTGDQGHLGQDIRFFSIARKLGYRLWMDASVECAHGHTVWLTRKLYKLLGHQYQQAENWDILFQASRERNGMDKKTAQIRVEQLGMRRKEIHEELMTSQKRSNELKTRLAVIDGQIVEREMDLKQRDYPPGAKPVPLPILGSEEAKALALQNRTKPPEHAGIEEELREKRREVYKKESEQRIEALEDEE